MRLHHTITQHYLWWPVLVPLATSSPVIIATVCLAAFGRGMHPLWFYGPALALGIIFGLLIVLAIARRARLIRKNDGRLCTRCLYPLAVLSAPGKCPECGEPFPEDAHRSYWEKHARLPPDGPRT